MKEDMARNQMMIEMAEERKRWHVMIQAGILRSIQAYGCEVRIVDRTTETLNCCDKFCQKLILHFHSHHDGDMPMARYLWEVEGLALGRLRLGHPCRRTHGSR